MIVTLLPFFVAANITANVGDWKNGPEVIYDAKINYLNYPLNTLNRTFVDNFTMKFKCRPKTESSLSCVIREPVTSSIVLINGVEDRSKVTVEPYVLDKDRMGRVFELDFNDHGLGEIVVDGPSADQLIIDTVKALAEQLNIGAHMPSIPLSFFSIRENSTTRQCETDFAIKSDRLRNDDEKVKKNSYEIVIVPTMREVRRGEIKEIKKSISANKCPYRYQYFDSEWNEIGETLKERTDPPKFAHESELKSSKSRITILESNFTSSTEDVMIVTNQERNSTTRRIKKTTITLYDIVPAKDPLPLMEHPKRVNRFAHERLH